MWRESVLVLLAGLALSGCDRAAESNPNAPGSPGTGAASSVVAPQAGDSPAGGSSGMAGSVPTPGSSGGGAVPGTSGSGTSEVGGRSQSPQPGTGLNGGLGDNAATPQAAQAAASAQR